MTNETSDKWVREPDTESSMSWYIRDSETGEPYYADHRLLPILNALESRARELHAVLVRIDSYVDFSVPLGEPPDGGIIPNDPTGINEAFAAAREVLSRYDQTKREE